MARAGDDYGSKPVGFDLPDLSVHGQFDASLAGDGAVFAFDLTDLL
jgi:hypothetical protein